MTDKQKLFISEYLKDFNATRAAKAAGYSEDTAGNIGHENLTKPEIKAAVDKHKKTMLKDADAIVYANIAYWQKVRDDEDASAGIRLKATELLGKYAAMFTERIDVTADVKVETELDLSKLSKKARKELRDAVG